MAKQILVASLLFFLLVACESTPAAQITAVPMTPTSTSIPPTSVPTPTSNSHVESIDLSMFASTWSSHDVSAIRALYTGDARYFTEEEAQKLQAEEPIDVIVSDDAFADHVQKFDGFQMRILGKPIGIFGKLVAFAFRWEKDETGYNGVALLRYEEEKIFLHVDIVSAQQTPTQTNESAYLSSMNLDSLMKAWNDADTDAAQKVYSNTAMVLSDEDLVQAPWRDFIHPPQIQELFTQFAGWGPVVISEPLHVEDMVIFAWHWNKINYPAGYGVRLLHYYGSFIVTDIRFAIRPWEGNGKNFMNP